MALISEYLTNAKELIIIINTSWMSNT